VYYCGYTPLLSPPTYPSLLPFLPDIELGMVPHPHIKRIGLDYFFHFVDPGSVLD